jgi:methionyl-tRNA formyltransferase
MKLILCVTGFKGWQFLGLLVKHSCVEAVITYRQRNVIDDSFDAIEQLCTDNKIDCIIAQRPRLPEFEPFDLCFIVGWQYLLTGLDDRCVIFHDSLLPKYRGFSPTVAAMFMGDTRIGVSAILPSEQADRGGILDQEAMEIAYPITSREVFGRLAVCYNRIAERLLLIAKTKPISAIAQPQDESAATYSLWRDEKDQRIDWSHDSEKIQRVVNALTWPFSGARSYYQDREIIIHAVTVEPDLALVERHPGKVWQISDGRPLAVCGSGMLRVDKATTVDGAEIAFTRVRSRFG